MNTIYLDSAATAPVCAEAAAAVADALTHTGNPSSRHALGALQTAALAAHRATVAAALGCEPDEFFFTSGGTEADNWAIHAALEHNRRVGRHIIAAAIEHAAVREPLRALEQQGYPVTWLRPERDGIVPPDAVRAALRADTALVCLMLVNNELGTVQPVAQTAALLQECGSAALLHTDGVQGFCKLPTVMVGADLVAVSGHKIGAPKGVGGLYIRRGLNLSPLLRGGGQEGGMRPGTEPMALIAGFAAACRRGSWAGAVAPLRAHAVARLQTVPGVQFLTDHAHSAPHILALSLPGYPGEVTARVLSDRYGICVSTGAACHRGKPGHVFAALGLGKPVTDGVLRISLSPENTADDVDALVRALREVTTELMPKRY